MSTFRSTEEFREVMDKVFTMMSEDPEMGPKLREADVPQRDRGGTDEASRPRDEADGTPRIGW